MRLMEPTPTNARPSDRERLLSEGRAFVHDTRNHLAVAITSLDRTARQPTLPPELQGGIDRALAAVRQVAQELDRYNALLRSFDEDRS